MRGRGWEESRDKCREREKTFPPLSEEPSFKKSVQRTSYLGTSRDSLTI